eukprot:CAMPEP_0202510394 /NCGR_PEP_ID=MMETSP1361-20130828/53271_1 /ASSEMBLY_ACC=CAM_ASM_000849 /TAXON_ID=210615 /ORGANISM="Staurosira complex sp., Strain CCMP2646" /LENGTH=726 /DNA_ID=CAMNT_0049144655 /DNA_START=114 /DNA_END=2294 /DNA_ORIENTATION=+
MAESDEEYGASLDVEIASISERTNDSPVIDMGISERPNAMHQRVEHSSFRSLGTENAPDEERDKRAKAISTRDAMGSQARRRDHLKKTIISPLRKRRVRWRSNVDGGDEMDSLDRAPSMHGRLSVSTSHIHQHHDSDEESGRASTQSRGIQYRLSAHTPRTGLIHRFLGSFGITLGSAGMYDDAGGATDSGCLCCGVSPNRWVTAYLNWTFRASFLKVIFTAAVGFYILTLFFALLIFWSGVNHPVCIHVNGQDFGASGDRNRFRDAYALSWTTFSTVGYGLVHPSTSGTVVDERYKACTGAQILTTFESFVGLLYASFCGAIIFGKVARARSHAQVIFSDPIVVRYGPGVAEATSDDSSSEEEANVAKEERLPCPVLEFRVLNRLHSVKGGEIMDATMNVVASIDESQACTTVRRAARGRRRKGRRKRQPSNHRWPAIPCTVSEQQSLEASAMSLSNDDDDSVRAALFLDQTGGKTYQAVDEDLGGDCTPRRIFAKLELETPEHPFFKRVWTARHTLNAKSPLLSTQIRRRIRENNGFWPSDLNHYNHVRACIHFDQILVSLSGTSNADANSVYSQKVYDYVDVNVGYRFANVIYRDTGDGSLGVDHTIINDVLEQVGGGAEPLNGDSLEKRAAERALYVKAYTSLGSDSVVYRDMGDGSLGVDRAIINDVLEQVGGGAEPLNGDSLKKNATNVLFNDVLEQVGGGAEPLNGDSLKKNATNVLFM